MGRILYRTCKAHLDRKVYLIRIHVNNVEAMGDDMSNNDYPKVIESACLQLRFISGRGLPTQGKSQIHCCSYIGLLHYEIKERSTASGRKHGSGRQGAPISRELADIRPKRTRHGLRFRQAF
jgi:hypothetical protein